MQTFQVLVTEAMVSPSIFRELRDLSNILGRQVEDGPRLMRGKFVRLR